MKRIISLALALGMLVGATAHKAEAVELKTSGYFMVSGQGMLKDLSNTDVYGNNTMNFYNRVELLMQAKVSDDLMGTLKFRLPKKATFGDTNFDLSSSTNSMELQLREAFIDYSCDFLDLRSGQQFYSLPGYMGTYNPIVSSWNPLTGFVASADVAMLRPTIAWFITGYDDTIGINSNLFTVSLPILLPDNMKVSPWFAYSDVDKNSSTAFIGATFDAKIDAIVGTLGAIVTVDSSDTDSSYLVSGSAAMNLDMFTSGVAIWYGNKGDNGYSQAGTGGGVAGSGRWGGFNGASTYFFGNSTGLTATASAPYSPFQSLGVIANINNFVVHENIKAGIHFMYMMDSADSDADNAIDTGVKLTAPLTQGLDFTLNANYLRQNDTNQAFFGGTMQMNF